MRIILCLFFLSMVSCLEKNHNTGTKTKVENTDTLYREYHSNGEIKVFSKKKYGKLNGEHVRFLKNGNILQSGYYLDDVKTGLWREYSDDGTLKKVTFYIKKDSVLTLNKRDFEFKEYKSLESSGINFVRIPKYWNTDVINDTIVLLVSKKNIESNYSPNISIKKERVPQNILLSDYVKIVNDNHKKNETFEILNIEKGFIDGLECYKCNSRIEVKGIKIGVFQVFYRKNNTVYIFSGLAENDNNFINYKALYNLISDTILFE